MRKIFNSKSHQKGTHARILVVIFGQPTGKPLYRGLQVAWHKNRDEIGACTKFGGNFELKFCACADFVAIFVPSNLQSSVNNN